MPENHNNKGEIMKGSKKEKKERKESEKKGDEWKEGKERRWIGREKIKRSE